MPLPINPQNHDSLPPQSPVEAQTARASSSRLQLRHHPEDSHESELQLASAAWTPGEYDSADAAALDSPSASSSFMLYEDSSNDVLDMDDEYRLEESTGTVGRAAKTVGTAVKKGCTRMVSNLTEVVSEIRKLPTELKLIGVVGVVGIAVAAGFIASPIFLGALAVLGLYLLAKVALAIGSAIGNCWANRNVAPLRPKPLNIKGLGFEDSTPFVPFAPGLGNAKNLPDALTQEEAIKQEVGVKAPHLSVQAALQAMHLNKVAKKDLESQVKIAVQALNSLAHTHAHEADKGLSRKKEAVQVALQQVQVAFVKASVLLGREEAEKVIKTATQDCGNAETGFYATRDAEIGYNISIKVFDLIMTGSAAGIPGIGEGVRKDLDNLMIAFIVENMFVPNASVPMEQTIKTLEEIITKSGLDEEGVEKLKNALTIAFANYQSQDELRGLIAQQIYDRITSGKLDQNQSLGEINALAINLTTLGVVDEKVIAEFIFDVKLLIAAKQEEVQQKKEAELRAVQERAAEVVRVAQEQAAEAALVAQQKAIADAQEAAKAQASAKRAQIGGIHSQLFKIDEKKIPILKEVKALADESVEATHFQRSLPPVKGEATSSRVKKVVSTVSNATTHGIDDLKGTIIKNNKKLKGLKAELVKLETKEAALREELTQLDGHLDLHADVVRLKTEVTASLAALGSLYPEEAAAQSSPMRQAPISEESKDSQE